MARVSAARKPPGDRCRSIIRAVPGAGRQGATVATRRRCGRPAPCRRALACAAVSSRGARFSVLPTARLAAGDASLQRAETGFRKPVCRGCRGRAAKHDSSAPCRRAIRAPNAAKSDPSKARKNGLSKARSPEVAPGVGPDAPALRPAAGQAMRPAPRPRQGPRGRPLSAAGIDRTARSSLAAPKTARITCQTARRHETMQGRGRRPRRPVNPCPPPRADALW